jgi:hypothetical protein
VTLIHVLTNHFVRGIVVANEKGLGNKEP